MKRPDEVFGDVYTERLRSREHDIAVAEAFAASMFDLDSRGIRRYQDLAVRFKLVADNWNRAGASQINALREALCHEYTDWELGR